MRRSFLMLLLLPTAAFRTAAAQTDPPAEYAKLTNPLAAATNFNIETVRGMVLTDQGLYAINTHASTIVRHADFTTPGSENEWPTVANPVAIALWNDRLLVVGGASWSLAEHDRTTGRILRHVDLAAEPADIVVDHDAGAAYVACQGSNVVVRIDLATFTENNRYLIPSQRPRFLFLDESESPASVYVAPFLSGNNTTLSTRVLDPTRTEDEVTSRVVDLDATATPGGDLPDEDLYRIDPSAPPGVAVTAVLHGAGTLLTEHARNPVTGEYWLISTESGNGDLNAQGKPKKGEHEHRGVFAKAQLAIANNVGSGTRPTPYIVRDLDIPIGGGAKSTNTSMSFPFALTFHASGAAVIASSTSDLLTMVDSSGVRLFDVAITQVTQASQPAMPPQIGRAIPRDLLIHAASGTLFVYCWGWNKVLVYQLNNLTAAPFWVDLGPDPAPVAVQKGRNAIFYNARRPAAAGMPGNATCNQCHPAGGTDVLAWQLSDSTKDRKDLMVTQSLLSIADLFPYHWRGERNLDHFNGAFVGLLGHQQPLDETAGGELDQFEAFVFSLQAPANPHQHIDRVLDGMSARRGQDVFLNKPNVLGPFTCAECHAMPGGANGERVTELFNGIASTSHLDVAHLRQLTHKDQGPFTVVVPDVFGNNVTVTRARNGFGLSHDGVNFDVPDFIKPSPAGPFAITSLEQQQLSDFVRQFDQGIAPAAHRAWLMTPTNASQVSGTITAVLLTQAAPNKRWVDVAAFGYEPSGSTVVDLRWAYDPATGLFTCHDASQPARSLGTFVQQAAAGAVYLFVGLPPGNAFRFALDPDNDALTDAQELPGTTRARNRDTDGDSYDDGYEVQVGSDPLTPNVPVDGAPPGLLPGTAFVRDHETATFAKFSAQFDEPVTWRLEAVNPANNQVVSITRGAALQRQATIHMHELYPSTPFGGDTRSYVPRLTIFDPRGNPATITGSQFTTTKMLVPPPFLPVLIDDLAYQTVSRTGGTLTVTTANVRVRSKLEQNGSLPLQGKVVLAHVLKRSPGQAAWEISKNTSSQVVLQGALVFPQIALSAGPVTVPYNALDGDFLLSTPTDGQGNATFTFDRHLLATNDEVRIAVLAVLTPTPGVIPTFDFVSMFEWDLSTTQGGATPTVPTARDLRGVTIVF